MQAAIVLAETSYLEEFEQEDFAKILWVQIPFIFTFEIFVQERFFRNEKREIVSRL